MSTHGTALNIKLDANLSAKYSILDSAARKRTQCTRLSGDKLQRKQIFESDKLLWKGSREIIVIRAHTNKHTHRQQSMTAPLLTISLNENHLSTRVRVLMFLFWFCFRLKRVMFPICINQRDEKTCIRIFGSQLHTQKMNISLGLNYLRMNFGTGPFFLLHGTECACKSKVLMKKWDSGC